MREEESLGHLCILCPRMTSATIVDSGSPFGFRLQVFHTPGISLLAPPVPTNWSTFFRHLHSSSRGPPSSDILNSNNPDLFFCFLTLGLGATLTVAALVFLSAPPTFFSTQYLVNDSLHQGLSVKKTEFLSLDGTLTRHAVSFFQIQF